MSGDNQRDKVSAEHESAIETTSTQDYPSQETMQLLGEPSVKGWTDELEDILAGERDFILRPLGSVSAHTERLIRSSEDERAARKFFKEALGQIVEEWQPFQPESDYYIACLIDLISAYLPRGGFRKIIGFMEHGFHFPVIEPQAGGFGSGMDLHMKALIALEYYYPSAEPKWEQDPAFLSYVQVLHQHLEDRQDKRYQGYALSRLMRLNIIKSQEQVVRDTIERDTGVLEELIELFLSPMRRSQLEEDLKYIFTHCFIIGLEAKQVFEQVLKEHDATVENYRQQLKVMIDDVDQEIVLDVPEDLMLDVLEEGGDRGYQRAMAAAANTTNDDE